MSYIVTKTDGTTLTTIVDGTADSSSTSLTLLGRNYSNYGQLMANNLVWLLENFSSTSSPNNPITGQIWWKKDAKQLQVYTGSSWKTVNSTTAALTPPSTTTAGDMWWDLANQQLYTYNGSNPYNLSGWILVGPLYSSQFGVSGPVWEKLIDNTNSVHYVLSVYLNGIRTMIVNTDASFIPQISIPGFITVNTGVNLRTTDQIWGKASDSTMLNSQPASKYFRNDVDNITTGNIMVLNNNGVTVGSASQFKLNIIANDTYLTSTVPGGSVKFYINNGSSQEVLHLDGVSGQVSVTADPLTNLGVATKQYVDNKFINSILYGNPISSTQAPGDNTTKIATTAFVYQANTAIKSYVDQALSNSSAGLYLKANIASPTFTGNPQAPTRVVSDSSDSIATTAFVNNYVQFELFDINSNYGLKANIADPVFTGIPRAPTQPIGTADSSIATTSFVLNNSGFKANSIYQGYSNFTILDTGTGSASLTISNSAVLTATVNGVHLTQGATGFTQTPDTNNTSLATTAFVKTATQTWAGSAKFVSTSGPDSSLGNNGDFWFQYQ